MLFHKGQRLHARQVLIPDTYNHALQSEFKGYWLDAMTEHIAKLESNGIWTTMSKSDMLKGARRLLGKWLLLKLTADNFVISFRARWVIAEIVDVLALILMNPMHRLWLILSSKLSSLSSPDET